MTETGYDDRWRPVPLPAMDPRPVWAIHGNVCAWFDGVTLFVGLIDVGKPLRSEGGRRAWRQPSRRARP